MLEKIEHLQRIIRGGIIAVVRAEGSEQALKIAEAIREGGIDSIEITMTVPGAVGVISELVKAYPNKEVLIGAGTVMDAETARACLLAGAEFIVSPGLNEDVIRLAHRYQKIVMPGAMSVTEVVHAMEAGGDIIKVFPGSLFGPEIIKAIRGPLPYAPLCPTGGVSLNNVTDWIKAGAVAVGVGGELTKPGQKGDYVGVTRLAQEFVAAIKAARTKG